MGEYPGGGAGPLRRCEDRTAVITGGASGIGRATAQRLADEGAAIVLLGHDTGRGHAAADQPAASGDVIGVNLRGCAAARPSCMS